MSARPTTISAMMLEAVEAKSRDTKGAASMQAIKKYLEVQYQINMVQDKGRLFEAITEALRDGRLRQVSGRGFSGSFTLVAENNVKKTSNKTAVGKKRRLTPSQSPLADSSNQPPLPDSSSMTLLPVKKESHEIETHKAQKLEEKIAKLLEDCERIQMEKAKVEKEKADESAYLLSEIERMSVILRDETLSPGTFCRFCFQIELPRELCCGDVYYCTPQCQYRDWSRHRPVCTKIKVKIGKSYLIFYFIF